MDMDKFKEIKLKSGARIYTFKALPKFIPRLPVNAKKLTLVLFALVGCWIFLVGWVLAQRPDVEETRQGHFISQEAVDAVQDTQLMQLTAVVNTHSAQLLQLEADRNWLMGGLAMIGGVFVIVQIMQIVAIRKKD